RCSRGPFRQVHTCHTNNNFHIRNRANLVVGIRVQSHSPSETPGRDEGAPSISVLVRSSFMLERRQGSPPGRPSAPSFSGLGRRPFTAVARVRIPLGSLTNSIQFKSMTL